MPTFPLDVRTELLLDGVWTDITADTYQRDSITIKRGRADESANTDPSSCSLTLDNRSGNYSPRNPTGTHFGVIGRNTPLRVLVPTGLDTHLQLPGSPASYATTPDHASLDVVGDLDVRLDIEPNTWRPSGVIAELVRKYEVTGDQRSWRLLLGAGTGLLSFMWTTAGTTATRTWVFSTAAVPETSTRLAVRATLDVDNGAGGNTVTFYTAPTIDGPWTVLGAPVVTAALTSVYASTAPLEIGHTTGLSNDSAALGTKVYALEVRNGIGGSLVASPDFRTQDGTWSTFTDAQSRPWTLHGAAVIANPNARFHGEVSTWPQRWDTSGRDAYSPLQAYGILRRLGQGAAPVKSSMFRDLSAQDAVVAYWPLEEPRSSARFSSGLAGDTSFLTPAGAVTLADDDDSFASSLALPTVDIGTISGIVPPYTGATDQRFTVLVSIPDAAAWASEKLLLSIATTGAVNRWDVYVTAAGETRLRAFNLLGLEVVNQVDPLDMLAGPCALSLLLEQNGADINWQLEKFAVGATSAASGVGSVATMAYGRVATVTLGSSADLEGTTFGHVFILNEDTAAMWDIIDTSLIAWEGELAGERIVRLCNEEGIPVTITGHTSDTVALGPQVPETLLSLLREAAESDLGILYEPREFLGLAYRTRESLYSQAPALTLDHRRGDLSAIEPVEDDQGTRNDITVKRQGGSSARVELASGPLSVNPPPSGVGRYDEAVTISASTDLSLRDQASWRLHLGTVNEARYPVLGINLATDTFAGDTALTASAQAVDAGDKVTLSGLPAWLPPDDVAQAAQGFTETLTRHQWLIDVNCSPGSPWDVGVWDEDEGPGEARYSSDGSTLNAGVTATSTSLTVATPAGPLWGTAGLPFDITVGGERMTVTGVTGATSPQTFTVTRSVNGIVKAHDSGAEVALFKPARYAL